MRPRLTLVTYLQMAGGKWDLPSLEGALKNYQMSPEKLVHCQVEVSTLLHNHGVIYDIWKDARQWDLGVDGELAKGFFVKNHIFTVHGQAWRIVAWSQSLYKY